MSVSSSFRRVSPLPGQPVRPDRDDGRDEWQGCAGRFARAAAAPGSRVRDIGVYDSRPPRVRDVGPCSASEARTTVGSMNGLSFLIPDAGAITAPTVRRQSTGALR
ncbi:hypothetical protein GCM10010472_22580 [Pseudonocardia halophobica]|uniref:Uncharacterized protein n=1 Tax=Pseudonocardia halophobica TaxID=29401 RepID=A0A9W6NTP3_9PSEU|nr:hypothetical protein GCM10017577_06300 [Pseudonocardia halophobica]